MTILNILRNQDFVIIKDKNKIVQFPLIGDYHLDREHIEILRLLDKKVKGDSITGYLNFSAIVMSYIFHHFREEEEFMQKIHFPGFKLHHAEHISCKNVIEVLFKEYSGYIDRRSMQRIHEEVIQECKKVLFFHILNYDLPFSKFVKYKTYTLDNFSKV